MGSSSDPRVSYFVNINCTEFKSTVVDSKTMPPGFAGGSVVENLPANAGDTGSSPGLGRSHMPQSG